MINKDLLKNYCFRFGIDISDECADKLDLYAEMLVEGNKRCNLTAITEPDEIVVKHFLDSLSSLDVFRELFPGEERFSVIDVGSGAGFPGVVLAAAESRMRVTLLDSSQKRVDFLCGLCERLELDCECVHARAEDAGHDGRFRERFDGAVSRAVASLNVLAEYCLPFVKTGGFFAAYKGRGAEDEIAASENALSVLNASICKKKSLVLPDESSRLLCVCRKDGTTDEKYPRKPSKIAKQPL